LQEKNEDLKTVLEVIGQPVFLMERDRVVYRNARAAAYGVEPGQTAEALFGARPALPAPGARAACLELPLAGKRCQTVVCPLEERLLFAVQELPAQPAQSLQLAAQSLRLPLSNLFACASSLFPMLEELEDPSLQRRLSELNRAYYQLLRLSGNLSDMGRLLSGEAVFARVRTDLSEYLPALLGRVEPLCRAAGLRLKWKLPQGSFFAWIDSGWLERALLNLFSNAMKFTPKGGCIRFTAERGGSFVTFRISDSGEGMDGAALASAFARSERDGGTGDPRWGVGFGLPIAQEVARRHGGAALLQARPDGTDAILSISDRQPEEEPLTVKSPLASFDYTGGFRHELVELADVLPPEVYDTRNVN
jgi:signal transduction histidine kinase